MTEQTFDFAMTLRCYRKSLGLDQDELAMRDDAGPVILTTYAIDEHWWLADERARDLALPASMHQAATAQAAREIAEDEGTFVAIRASR